MTSSLNPESARSASRMPAIFTMDEGSCKALANYKRASLAEAFADVGARLGQKTTKTVGTYHAPFINKAH